MDTTLKNLRIQKKYLELKEMIEFAETHIDW